MIPAKVNPTTREWRTIEELAAPRLEQARRKIDSRGIDERDADFERGRLAELRWLLSLGKPTDDQTPATRDDPLGQL